MPRDPGSKPGGGKNLLIYIVLFISFSVHLWKIKLWLGPTFKKKFCINRYYMNDSKFILTVVWLKVAFQLNPLPLLLPPNQYNFLCSISSINFHCWILFSKFWLLNVLCMLIAYAIQIVPLNFLCSKLALWFFLFIQLLRPRLGLLMITSLSLSLFLSCTRTHLILTSCYH